MDETTGIDERVVGYEEGYRDGLLATPEPLEYLLDDATSFTASLLRLQLRLLYATGKNPAFPLTVLS